MRLWRIRQAVIIVPIGAWSCRRAQLAANASSTIESGAGLRGFKPRSVMIMGNYEPVYAGRRLEHSEISGVQERPGGHLEPSRC
jgi:hypothetical protein|tara:strand:- start:94 stop:345 length:252 start_codon:yes stop_codon:yes gene_type:complete